LPKKRFPEAEADLRSGKTYMQDPFTRHPAELLSVRPGERILDLCAAPGGKTRMLAQAMQGKGVLVALDKPGKRMERLRENLDRAGLEWVSTVADRVESFSKEKLQDITGSEQVDGILIDVPCSTCGPAIGVTFPCGGMGAPWRPDGLQHLQPGTRGEPWGD
jgi:16S rRNA C967 or C1407 C5-methylase (RsmB/RsmF family)